jgi:hypothetical protein
MTSQLIREPAPDGLREAARKVVDRIPADAPVFAGKMREALLELAAALAQPAQTDALREAAETVIAEAVIDGSGAASVPKGAMRKLAIAVNKAALAQPAPEPEGYYALLQAGDSITIRNTTLAPMKVPVPSGATLMGDYRPTPEPAASEPALTFRDRAMLAALTGLLAHHGCSGEEWIQRECAAREALDYADALCAARESGK